MVSRRLLLLLVLLLAVLPAHSALANSAGPQARFGHTGGPIVPRQDSAIRVDAEDLRLKVGPEHIRTARVTATYTMTNTTDRDASTEIAFIYVDRGNELQSPPEITVDSTPVAFRQVTDAEFFAPLVDEWLDAHPAVLAELQPLADAESLSPATSSKLWQLLTEAGVKLSQNDLYSLVHYRHRPTADSVTHAAMLLMPDQVREVYRSWSPWMEAQHADGKVGPHATWLIFSVPFPPGARHEVSVSYLHLAAAEGDSYNRPFFRYEYLLSPARAWAGFGTLDVHVDLPPDTALQTDFPLQRAETGYVAHLNGLPAGELVFTVRSTEGVILGVDRAHRQWALFLLVMAVPGALVGWFLGRRWAVGSTDPPHRYILCLTGTPLFAGMANCAWLAVLWQVWQPYGPYRGLAIFGGWLQAVVVATAVSVIASLIATSRVATETSPPGR